MLRSCFRRPGAALAVSTIAMIVALGETSYAEAIPLGQVNEFSGGLQGAPFEMAPGPDGNLWFTTGLGKDTIGQISVSGTIKQFSAGLNAGSTPNLIAPA